MSLTAIEKTCIDAHRFEVPTQWHPSDSHEPSQWLCFGLTLLLQMGRLVRGMRLLSMKDTVHFKKDGSPATKQEEQIEVSMREELSRFCPDAQLLGEETGGTIPSEGIAVAIDPVDGTWALVNRTETCATTLVFLRDRAPFLGMVLNPVTGELGYAFPDSRTRLLQLSIFGEDDVGCDLPLDRVSTSNLVNVHPGKNAGVLINKLFKVWKEGGIGMVRMPGGSPAFAMLEAAKGSFTYVNLWSENAAVPYDLGGAILLVRGAGGDVIDLSGKSVDELSHSGPFIAGVDEKLRLKLARLTRQALDDSY